MKPATIVRGFHPMYAEIDAAFGIRGRPTVLSWGDKIYIAIGNPQLPAPVVAHENAHGERQLEYGLILPGAPLALLPPDVRIAAWWKRYIADAFFRRQEEIIAHRAEYEFLCKHSGSKNDQRRYLGIVATKLSQPFCGLTKAEARKVLSDVNPPRS